MRPFKSSFLLTLLFLIGSFGVMAEEVSWRPYSDSIITSEGPDQIALLGFHKRGCSTCAVQDAALASILSDSKFSNIVPVKIQIEDEELKQIVTKYKVVRQSTLILLRNGKEIGRTAPGTTDSGEIRRFLEKTL